MVQLHTPEQPPYPINLLAVTKPARRPVAVYLLLHDKPIQSFAALIVALGSAIGPKIYVDFIQPKPEQPGQPPPALL